MTCNWRYGSICDVPRKIPTFEKDENSMKVDSLRYAVLDGPNIIHHGGNFVGMKIDKTNLGIALINLVNLMESIEDEFTNFIIVLKYKTLDGHIADYIRNKFPSCNLKFVSYKGNHRNGDDIVAVSLAKHFNATIISGDNFNKEEDFYAWYNFSGSVFYF